MPSGRAVPRREAPSAYPVAIGWRDIDADPNVPEVIAARAAVLLGAFVDPPPDRITFFQQYCRGRRVLDLGCVDHTASATHWPTWLHGQLAEVAAEIVGVDVDEDGLAAMRAEGFDVIKADITRDTEELLERDPFDVVVAGELIEHLDAPIRLFRLAAQLLRPEGRLLISTPNPYALWRGRKGARRETWESADHVAYYPPTGIAELADRAGLELLVAATVDQPTRRRMLARSVKRRLYGRHHEYRWPSPLDVLIYHLRAKGGQLGETALYVVGKPPSR